MKQKSKSIINRIMTFMLTVSMVLGLVPIDGLMKVAYASETTYSITIADGIINGTVTADKTTAVKGETVTLTISPDNLYELYDLSVKCGENAVPFYWATTSFVMPDGDVTVNVSFKKKTTYTTFFKYSGKTFSKTTPNGESSTFELKDVLDALLGTTTDEINNVDVNGSCISASQQNSKWMLTTYYGGDSFESTAVLKVTVGDSEYSIDISASQDSIPVIIQGSVRFDANGGSGTMDTMSGRSDKFFVLPECSFTPPDGMEFDNWKIGSDYYPAGTTYRWKESVIAYAQWKDIEGVHSTLVSNSDPSKGSLVVSPTKALQNTNIVLTPQPANGYAVDSISYSYEGSGTLQPTANQDGTYSFSMPDKDVTVTITFKEDTAVSIPYLDANGNNANCTSNTYVSESDTTWNTGWYVVNRTLTINNRIVVEGNVNLILADGATLNAQSGITVYGNNSLNIFAQSTGENKGKLCADATQKPNYAAIGGANSEETMNCGTVNIYGGYIEAHGGQNSAGIGGGNVSSTKGGSGGTITINAGTIKSYGGNWYGSGVGGGRHGNGGTIRINGGNIEAFGNYGAAGIGGGLDGQSGNIKITGGTVLAKGSICEGYKPAEGAGIGSGRDAEANRIEITGGNITAYGASNSAAIGSGRNFKCNEIIISGGVVNAIAYSTKDVGIGSSRSSTSTGTISLSWTSVSSDEISSSSYKGTVTLKKAFVDKSDSTVTFASGVISDNSTIDGKTIVPYEPSTHYHKYTYSVSDDGKTITAKCANEGCSLTNNEAILTIAAPTGSLVYNGSAKNAAVTGDTSVLGTPIISYKKGNTSLGSEAPKNAGTYEASITLGTGDNMKTASVSYTIVPKEVTLTWNNTDFTYDGETHIPSVTLGGLVGTDSCKVSVGGGATNAGIHTATASDLTNLNYVLPENNTAEFSIKKAVATVSANNASKIYGEEDPVLSATVTGAITGETINYTVTRVAGEDVGKYKITITPGENPNYQVTTIDGEFTIKSAHIHNLIKTDAVAATCINAGNSAYWTCSSCGKYFSDAQGTTEIEENAWVEAALGHSYEVGYLWSEDNKTCTATGTCIREGCDEGTNGHVITETVNSTSETTAASCEGKGKIVYTATFTKDTFAKQTKTVETDALGHSYDVTYSWSDDGKSCIANAVCANNSSHTVSENGAVTEEVTTPATCKAMGVTTYTATFTNTLFTTQTKDVTDVDKLSTHTPAPAVSENTIPASCETDGSYDEVIRCSVCGIVISSNTIPIPALGHDWGVWIMTKEPSETETGLYTRTCKRDPEHTETMEIPVTTHEHVFELVEEKPATCTSDGTKAYYKCTNGCDLKFSEADATKVILDESALVIKGGHKGGTATCCHKAVCDVCQEEYGAFDSTNHEGDTEIRGKVAETCTEDGYSGDIHCKACGALIEKGEVKKAAGHKQSDAVKESEIQALCDKAGSYDEVVRCSVCGEELSRKTVVVDALGHDYGAPIYEWSADGKECTATRKCSRCAKTESEKAVVTSAVKTDATTEKMGTTTYTATFKNTAFKTQNKDVEDIPVKSNDTPEPEPVPGKKGDVIKDSVSKAEFVITSDSEKNPTAEYSYPTDKSAKSVTVPDTVTVGGKTYKITSVKANAFKDSNATTVTIGKNITKLCPGAFNGSKVKTIIVKSTKLKKKTVKKSVRGCKAKKVIVKIKVGSKKLNKKYAKKYKKYFTKKNVGKKVKVK